MLARTECFATVSRRCHRRPRRAAYIVSSPQCIVVFGKYLGVNFDFLFVFLFSLPRLHYNAAAHWTAKWKMEERRKQQVPIWCSIEGIERCQSAVSMAALDSMAIILFDDAIEMNRRRRRTYFLNLEAKCRMHNDEHKMWREIEASPAAMKRKLNRRGTNEKKTERTSANGLDRKPLKGEWGWEAKKKTAMKNSIRNFGYENAFFRFLDRNFLNCSMLTTHIQHTHIRIRRRKSHK